MKTIAIIIAFIAGPFLTEAQNSITVSVNNVTSDTGHVLFSLHDAETFMKEPLKGEKAVIKDGVATVTFTDVPDGTYSIIALHDKNDDGRMNFQASGMPLEDYSTSGEAPLMGPPNFKDSSFELNKDIEITLRF